MKITRLSGEERRNAIVKAALPLFARSGFAKTTTRDLAKAAGVSEALIFKHFPNKEKLYEEIQSVGCRGGDPVLDRLAELEPSTSTLVHIIYYLVRVIAFGRQADCDSWECKHRLLVNSCLEDGAFARISYQNGCACYFEKIEASLHAAAASGDMVKSPVEEHNRLRFAHHVAAFIALVRLPEKPAIDYHASGEKLLHEAVWFVLRGIGLTDKAIDTYYNPKALSLFFGAGKAS